MALASIGLGVGVTTTVFTAVNGMFLRPLPYADADRIVVIHTRNVTGPDTGAVSWADFLSWRQAARSFEAMGTFGVRPAEFLEGGLEPTPLVIGVVSPGYFGALGIAPIHGSAFTERHQTFGNHFVALLSHGFWQRRYGGRAGAVGETITIEARPVPASPYVILGVLPEGASFPAGVDVFVPLQVDADEYEQHGSRQAQGVVARLRPGVSFDQSRAEVVGISKALQAQFPKENAHREAEVMGLRDDLVGDRRTPVLLLLAAAGLVMLIACANVASLMLARAGARRRELAVRAAIGAGRARLMRQLLTESVLLALAGGALGTLLGVLGARALVLLLPGGLPEYADVSVDVAVLTFVVALSAASALLFGLAPAWRSTAIGATGLRESDRIAGPPGTGRLRTTLIAAEVALSFVLLVGATLVWRSNHSLSSEFRFDRRIVWVSIATPAKYEGVRRETFFVDLAARARALPGVQSVGRAATGMPLGPFLGQRVPVRIAEGPAGPKEVESIVSEIDPSYLQTLNVAMVHGRGFNREDRPASPEVRRFSAIVNETLARQLGGSRIGAGPKTQHEDEASEEPRRATERPDGVVDVVNPATHNYVLEATAAYEHPVTRARAIIAEVLGELRFRMRERAKPMAWLRLMTFGMTSVSAPRIRHRRLAGAQAEVDGRAVIAKSAMRPHVLPRTDCDVRPPRAPGATEFAARGGRGLRIAMEQTASADLGSSWRSVACSFRSSV